MNNNKQINILFVDDEVDILEGFKRMLFSMKSHWGMYFAKNGYEALSILSSREIDVIISDFKMPQMNGLDLLNITKDQFPFTIRILLTGLNDEYKFLNSLNYIHKIIFKPCEASYIKNIIVSALELKKFVKNKDLMRLIHNVAALPAQPDIYFEIENELRNEDVSFEALALIIAKEPALVAQILHIVNSGFFGLSRNINNITEALSFLGINSVKSIILFLNTFTNPNNKPAINTYCKRIAVHSLIVANIAKNIGKELKLSRDTIDILFVSGLLHDIGKLVFVYIPDFLENKKTLIETWDISECEAENMLTRTTSNLVGAYLLGIWGFPPSVFNTVGNYCYPKLDSNNKITPELIIKIANQLAKYDLDIFDRKKLDLDWEQIELANLAESIELWWNKALSLKGIKYE